MPVFGGHQAFAVAGFRNQGHPCFHGEAPGAGGECVVSRAGRMIGESVIRVAGLYSVCVRWRCSYLVNNLPAGSAGLSVDNAVAFHGTALTTQFHPEMTREGFVFFLLWFRV